ncbi:MAG: ImmA/IrrE family metallo-endopeptidase [Rhodobacteraceae bacterium]|nr:ImmA/IrrE family metallo-endopeptidase [Paracoccaceae bacterium]
MSRIVPYLAEEAIERDAASLIAEYEHARGVTIEPPIPVEDIVEKYLKLRIEFDDMHARHNIPRPSNGQPDILGAIYGDGSIFIDESLDPEENPAREGRYRFTLAHEGGGHWRLHQHLIVQDTLQASFLDAASEPKFICRSSEAKERVEWQADFYASCLLMPRKMIFAAWDEFFPDRKQRVLQPEHQVEHGFVEVPKYRFVIGSQVVECETDNDALERFCWPLAERFTVSPIAISIRLEKLGLLHRVAPLQRLLAGK